MTALPETMRSTSFSPETPKMVDGARMLRRVLQMGLGSALVIAAIAFWMMPGATWDAEVALMKLAMTLALGFAGLAVVQAGRPRPTVEVEIDTVRREVRLVRLTGTARKGREVVSTTPLSDLGHVERVGTGLRLWAQDGALIAEVALMDAEARLMVMKALADAGKV